MNKIELPPIFRNKFFNLLNFPDKEKILTFFRKLANREDLFIVGGAVRDFLLDREIKDLDLVAKEDYKDLAYLLARILDWTLVPLSEEFGIYRIAQGEYSIDFTQYRKDTIIEDLKDRDFTMNALAIPLKSLFEEAFYILDPFKGLGDLQEGRIRVLGEENLREDPLRILRGYRLLALNYGNLEKKTRECFKKLREGLRRVAGERIFTELKYILLSERAGESFFLMEEDGVLEILFPEIIPGRGRPQPSFHHLDVLSHCLHTLKYSEEILKNPKKYLGLSEVPSLFYEEDFRIAVKLGSFFHDIGKGYTYSFNEKEKRITFYGHENKGVELWKERAKVLRFKKEIINWVSQLIKNHMRPCYLLKEWEKGTLSTRAKRKLLTDQKDLYSLWIIAVADSLASQGPDKERDYEERLNKFFKELLEFKEELEKVQKRDRLLTGKDLIALGFNPGPLFREILEEVEIKFLEGELRDKKSAITYVVKKYGRSL